MRNYAKRNSKIYDLYTKTEASMNEVGQIFGITRERVRQIIEEQKAKMVAGKPVLDRP